MKTVKLPFGENGYERIYNVLERTAQVGDMVLVNEKDLHQVTAVDASGNILTEVCAAFVPEDYQIVEFVREVLAVELLPGDWISTQAMFAQIQVGERYEVQLPDIHPARDCYNGWAERLESGEIVWRGTSSLMHPVNPITCKWRKVKESEVELTTSQLLEQLQDGQRAQMVNGQHHWNVRNVWREKGAIWYLDGDGERENLPMSDGVMAGRWIIQTASVDEKVVIEGRLIQNGSSDRAYIIGLAKQLLERRKRGGHNIEASFYNDGDFTKCHAEFVINRDKRTVVCLMRDVATKKVYKKGIAKCMPSDCFNSHIGKAIAFCRAIGDGVPDYLLSAPNPTEPQAGDVVEFYGIDGTLYRKAKVTRSEPEGLFSEEYEGWLEFIPEYGDRIVDDSRE